MPAGARVGTASLRRELMLRMNYPHLEVLPVRGNVGTRLRKLDAGEYDALVMASAGLKRLELHDRIRSIIPAEVSLPSPGQGALGVEIRSDNAAPAARPNAPSPARSAAPARFRSPPTASSRARSFTCAPSWATTRPAKPSAARPAVPGRSLKRLRRAWLRTSAVRVQTLY